MIGRVHCSVSIARFGQAFGLSASEKLVLCLLWLSLPDPFADRPRVTTSYGRLADAAGMSRVSLPRIVLRLVRLGCLTRLHTTPAGTTYVLERPEHEESDVDDNPFSPSETTTFAQTVAELVVPQVLDRVRSRKRSRGRTKPPAIKPSVIALALEDMAGVKPKINIEGKRVPSIKFDGRGAAHVRAAQRWITQHGLESFGNTCRRARQHVFADLVEPSDRLYLFDRPRALAELSDGFASPSTDDETEAQPASESASEGGQDSSASVAVERPRLRERLTAMGCVDVLAPSSN